MTAKRPTGVCVWCRGEIPAHYRADRKTCSDKCRGAFHRSGNPQRHLTWRYGITVEERATKLAEQDGRCAICGVTEEENLRPHHVDHDHRDGRVRSLLCSNCNTAIGKLQDAPALLRRAAAYIEEHRL